MFQATRVFSFAFIGILIALLYIGLYLAFLSLGLRPGAANGLAFGLAVVTQYIGQARFTFRRQVNDTRQMLRFGLMIAGGAATSTLITGVMAPSFMLPPLAAAVIVTLILPVQNFILMSLWVFSNSRDLKA
jgi:putative flippase GtrA